MQLFDPGPQFLVLAPCHISKQPDSVTFVSHAVGQAGSSWPLTITTTKATVECSSLCREQPHPWSMDKLVNKYVPKENIMDYFCRTKFSCRQDFRSNSDLFWRYFAQIFLMSLQRRFLVCVHGFVPNSSLPNTVIHLFVFYTLFDFSHIWLWLRTRHMFSMASQSDFLVFLDLNI